MLPQKLKPENIFRMGSVKDTDIDTMERLDYLSKVLELNKGFRIIKRI